MGVVIELAKVREARAQAVSKYPLIRCPHCGGPSSPEFRSLEGLTVLIAYRCDGATKEPHPGGARSTTFRVLFDINGRAIEAYSGWSSIKHKLKSMYWNGL
jgi:hypothetical protein